MKQLRPDQIPIVNNTIRALRDHRKVIMQSATGSGKSVMMLHIVARACKSGRTCLVLTESIKIFSQLANEFNAIRINSKTNYFVVRPGAVYVAMSQSLNNRKSVIEQFQSLGDDLILLIDEAHIGTTKKVIEQFNCPRIGATATPAWRWAKFLPELYTFLVEGLQVEELININSLTPYQHKGRKKIDATGLVKDSKGEYTERSQEIVFGETKVYEGLYEDLASVTYRKCMIYVASIKQAIEVNNNLSSHGFKSVMYHSQMNNAQDSLNQFHSDVDIMVSVAALTKGYDYAHIDLIILYRATTSLPLYLQMIGRGGRLLPGKTHFLVLDYGLNYDRFGAWDANRDWQKLWRPQPKKSEQPAPVKACPSCDSFLHTSAMVCKWCGFVFPVVERKYEQGDLVDFRSAYTDLIGKRISELNPEQLATYAKEKKAGAYAIWVAKSRRLEEKRSANPPATNFIRDFGKAMGYKPMWYQVATGDIDRAIKQGKTIPFRDFILQ